MKKVFVLILVMCLAATNLLFAAGQTEKTTDEDGVINITFVTPLIGHPVWLDAKKGAEDAAKEFGFNTSWVGPQGIDMDAMVQQIEIALAEDVDGIITCPLNPSAFTNVYKKAQEQGVLITNTAVDTPEDLRLAFIGTNAENMGIKGANALAEKMNGTGKIAVMQGSMDAGNQNESFYAFEETLKNNFPGMEIVVRESDDSDMLKAVDKFNAIFESYPEVNGIYCLEASAGPAAAKVVLERDLVGKITILAVDDMKDTLQYIRDGVIWGTATQNFYQMGYLGAKFIYDKINGQNVPSITDSGTIIVTQENIDSYKK